MTRKALVLPVPLGPTNATVSPGAMSMSGSDILLGRMQSRKVTEACPNSGAEGPPCPSREAVFAASQPASSPATASAAALSCYAADKSRSGW